MKHHPFFIFSVIVLAVLLVSGIYVMTKARTGDADTLYALVNAAADEELQDIAERQAEQRPAPTPSLTRVEGTTEVQGEGFTMDVPTDWIVIPSRDTGRIADGRQYLGGVANAESTALGTEQGRVSISVYEVMKGELNTYESIVQGFGWDAQDVTAIVNFMAEEAAAIFPDYSEADVLTETSEVEINGHAATKTTLTCLKPCYIEGGASTSAHYFVEAPTRVYLLFVDTATGDEASALLAEAEAVVKTFQVTE